MSNTLKTRPLSVRMADPNDKGVDYIEVHNHADRECDLPGSTLDKVVYGPVRPTQAPCHYSWTYTGHNLCGCKMCTGQVERKLNARRVRHEGKTQTRAAKYEANSKD